MFIMFGAWIQQIQSTSLSGSWTISQKYVVVELLNVKNACMKLTSSPCTRAHMRVHCGTARGRCSACACGQASAKMSFMTQMNSKVIGKQNFSSPVETSSSPSRYV